MTDNKGWGGEGFRHKRNSHYPCRHNSAGSRTKGTDLQWGAVPGSGCLALSLVNSEADSDSGAIMPCLCAPAPQGLGNEMGLASGKKSLEGLVEAVNCKNMSLKALMGGHKIYLFIASAPKLAPVGAP